MKQLSKLGTDDRRGLIDHLWDSIERELDAAPISENVGRRLHKRAALRATRSGRSLPAAMAAGLTDKLASWSDFVEMMDADQPAQKRGPYKKRIDA